MWRMAIAAWQRSRCNGAPALLLRLCGGVPGKNGPLVGGPLLALDTVAEPPSGLVNSNGAVFSGPAKSPVPSSSALYGRFCESLLDRIWELLEQSGKLCAAATGTEALVNLGGVFATLA